MARKREKIYVRLVSFDNLKYKLFLASWFIVVLEYLLGLDFGWLSFTAWMIILLEVIYFILYSMVVFFAH